MNIIQLKCFVAVAENLNFSKAAKKLFMTQPPLSRHINNLEQLLGVKLFIRNRQHVALTNEGKVFYEDVIKTLNQLNEAVKKVITPKLISKDSLKITFSCNFNNADRLVTSFYKKNPELNLEINELTGSQQIINSLIDNHSDIAFYYGKEDYKGIETYRVAEEEIVLAIPKNCSIAEKKEIPLSSLKNQDLIFFPRKTAPFWYDFFIQKCLFNGFSPNIVFLSAIQRTRLKLVNQGLGITVINERMKDLSLKNVNYCRFIKKDRIKEPFMMAWKKGEKNKNNNSFIDFMKNNKI